MSSIPSLYALSKQVILNHGLTKEDIEELIAKPDPLVPSHHQVDPRSIEAYLAISTKAPTFSIQFPSRRKEISLISLEYRRFYRQWKGEVEANNQLVQSPLGCSTRTQVLSPEESLHPSFRAGLVRWRNGYLRTYHYFDDCFLRHRYYNRLPGRAVGIALFAHRTPSTIYATTRDILLLCPRLPTAPIENFQNLSEEHKEGIYRYIEKAIERAGCRGRSWWFPHQAIARGDTGPNLPSEREHVFGHPYWVHRLPAQRFVIEIVCTFQVIASQSYANFPSIDQLRQILLDRYGHRTDRYGQRAFALTPSWEDGESATLSIIQPDDTIAELYFIYRHGYLDGPPNAPYDSSDSLFDESDDNLSLKRKHGEIERP